MDSSFSLSKAYIDIHRQLTCLTLSKSILLWICCCLSSITYVYSNENIDTLPRHTPQWWFCVAWLRMQWMAPNSTTAFIIILEKWPWLYSMHVASFHGPHPLYCTVSDKKLGGAWDQGDLHSTAQTSVDYNTWAMSFCLARASLSHSASRFLHILAASSLHKVRSTNYSNQANYM